MRDGFSLKEASAILGIHLRRVPQSLDPTLERMAKLWRMDPTKTMICMIAAVEKLDPMTPEELRLRELMATGRLDRSVVHPPSSGGGAGQRPAAFRQ